MPLDTHLNQDLHSSHDFHATVTQDLIDDNPRKFDGSTPKRLSGSYHRLFHPETGVAPSSKRIEQDVSRVIGSLELVLSAKGCIIDEKMLEMADNMRKRSITMDLQTVGVESEQKAHKQGTYIN